MHKTCPLPWDRVSCECASGTFSTKTQASHFLDALFACPHFPDGTEKRVRPQECRWYNSSLGQGIVRRRWAGLAPFHEPPQGHQGFLQNRAALAGARSPGTSSPALRPGLQLPPGQFLPLPWAGSLLQSGQRRCQGWPRMVSHRKAWYEGMVPSRLSGSSCGSPVESRSWPWNHLGAGAELLSGGGGQLLISGAL